MSETNYTVVDNVTDHFTQMSLEHAREIAGDEVEIGDTLSIEGEGYDHQGH